MSSFLTLNLFTVKRSPTPPEKLMVYASEFSEAFNDSVGFGWEERPLPSHTWSKFMEAKNKELSRLNGVYSRILANNSVTQIEGRGKITGPNTVEVETKEGKKTYTAKNIVIATGGRPMILDIPGKEHAITSDEALALSACPKKIAIIGGGYIGCEFACIFNGFGTEVHLMYRGSLPLRGFDHECREFLVEQLKTRGIQQHAGCNPVAIEKNADGKFKMICVDAENEKYEIDGLDQVMFATGRTPASAKLGLEDVGVKLNPKTRAVEVNEYSQTNIPSIWALGDVTNRMNLTPVALMEGMALAATLVKNQPTKPDYEYIASAVFTQPSLATCGITEETAIETLGDVDIYTTSFKPMKNTLSGNPTKTFMKLVVDAREGHPNRVVGCHMVGPDSAEIMQGLAVAMKMGCTKQQLDSVVGIHPSAAEEFVTMRSVSRQIRGGHEKKLL